MTLVNQDPGPRVTTSAARMASTASGHARGRREAGRPGWRQRGERGRQRREAVERGLRGADRALDDPHGRRGVGHDRILFATDAPWGDFEGEHARLAAAAGDGELADHFFRRNFEALYGS